MCLFESYCTDKLLNRDTNPIIIYLCKILIFDIQQPINGFRISDIFIHVYDGILFIQNLMSGLLDSCKHWNMHLLIFPMFKLRQYLINHFDYMIQLNGYSTLITKIKNIYIWILIQIIYVIIYLNGLLFGFNSLCLHLLQILCAFEATILIKQNDIFKSEKNKMNLAIQQRIVSFNDSILLQLFSLDLCLPDDIIRLLHEFVKSDYNDFKNTVKHDDCSVKFMDLNWIKNRYGCRKKCFNISLVEILSWKILKYWFIFKKYVLVFLR